MKTDRVKKFFVALGLAFAATLVLAGRVNAQLGAEVGAQAGLGGGDIRVIIGRIIQVALGLLGVVALGLIIYAGFLWMTAGGDEEKVATAKRTMSQAVVGLVIILSSFAIASFVVNSLVSATGGNTGNGGNNGGGNNGGGGLSTSDFTVSAINPPGDKAADFKFPKNVQIAIVFKNGSPDPSTTTASTISVKTNGAAVAGTVRVSGNTAIWSSSTKCEENAAYFCLPADATFNVSLSASVTSTGGRSLVCGLCAASFQTGNYIDTQPPTVSISSPVNNQSVPINSFVKIYADAKDDSAVATVDYAADGHDLGTVGVTPWEYDWDTTGLATGAKVTLGATATDIVGNTGAAAPVTVIARPGYCFDGTQDFDETGKDCGGPSCGACPGQPCTTDADCFSGLCVNNVCVDKPRIDSVDPTAGGPGTLVTIHGAGFGSDPGSVIFLGAKAGDEKSAAPCAPSAWSPNEVIVAVPDGAVSGPLELDTKANGSDRTNDAFGNTSIPNFTVTNVTLPGICTLDPAAGTPGTPVTVNGTGYGDNQGTNEVDFAGRSANVSNWAGAKITAATPNLLAGIWPVTVKVGTGVSNSVSFNVPPAASVPHILSIDPVSGPVGEYITITGSNFGNTTGRVNFKQGTDTYLGKTDFPAACGSDYWHDTSITVKAPSEGVIGAYTVSVMTNAGIPSDNSIGFSVGGGTPKPGLCRIDPSAGPPGTRFTLYGERLGGSTGTVTFTNNKNVTSFSSWSEGQVMGAVAGAATTGAVTATASAGATSNNVLYTVGNCKTANICAAGSTCCDDGTCRAPNTDGTSACAPSHHDGAYAYRFSTGVIPLVPHVVEDVACDKYTQSPSPYLKSADACVNANVSVRFDVGMNNATLAPANFTVVACGTDDIFDKKKCSTTPVLALKVMPFGASRPFESGMTFVPKDNFAKNTWYMGTIAKNVASVAGVNMDQDYNWIFRTRDSTEPCALSGINVCPVDNTLTDIWKPTDTDKQENVTYSAYLASPHAANCNAVKCEAYGWDWNTDLPSSVSVTGDQAAGVATCTAVARALFETPAAKAAQVNAVASVLGNPAKALATGTGNLVVKFTDPKVESYWPSCDNACLESEVGAKFNTAMDQATINKNTVKIFSCADETCRTTTDLGAAVNYTDSDVHTVTFPGVPLTPNKFYLVRILATAKSTAGVPLTGTNSVWNGTPAFSWYINAQNPTASFRIGTDHCKIAAVGINPPNVTTNIVGEYDSFTAMPMTAPDTCAPAGEKIDPFKISDWSWKIDPTPPTKPAGAELYLAGGANVRPVKSLFATSSCLRTGTEAAKPVCGNNVVEDGSGHAKTYSAAKGGGTGGEECDLGKNNDAPGTLTDGSTGSGCSANCLLTGARVKVCAKGDTGCCGDSVVQGICQDDPNNYLQSANPVVCTSNKDCGNGVCRFDVPGAEQCDVGAANGGANSGCSATCQALGANSITPSSTCGNPDVAFNEQCDDGNNASGDGCSSECRDEGSTAGISVCGNAKVEEGEDCDLGAANGKPGATCSAICKNTGTPLCAAANGAGCCGNATSDAGEDPGCDLGFDPATNRPKVADGCDLSCLKLGSSFTYSSLSVCADGQVGLGETVDPGPSDQNVDPTQYTHTIGLGDPDPKDKSFTSTVTATTGGISGTGTVKLQCGYTADDQCPVGNYVGYNSCCYGPPAVATPVTPPDGQGKNNTPGVCRNPLVEVPFDRLIDESTIQGNLKVVKTANCTVGDADRAAPGWSGFLGRVSAFLGNVWSLIIGRPVQAQSVSCNVTGTISIVALSNNGKPYSVLQFVPDIALDPGADYAIKVLGVDAKGAAHLRSVDGVALQSDFNSTFHTGSDICTLDKVLVSTNPTATANMDSYLFSDPNKLTDTFNAIPVHDDGTSLQPIAPLPKVYDWTWQWDSADQTFVSAAGTSANQAVAVVNKGKTGDVAVTAAATITADRINKDSTEKTSVAGETNVTVMICTAPWPARAGDGSWAPWPAANADGTKTSLPDNKYNFTLYYCRDNETKQLPTLGNPALTDNPTPDFLRQYLLTYSDPTFKSEGIGLRVAQNPKWLSPAAYYASRGFTGTPQPLKVAGYNAVQDGRTIYVDAPNYGSGMMYPNIYILSYTAGAGVETQNIFNQLKNSLRFNVNMPALDIKTCDASRATTCTSDAVCQKSKATDFCASPRDRLTRDTTRFEDLSAIAQAAVNIQAVTHAFPNLGSGTYMGGVSYSVWPSWGSEFGTELGAAPPADPLNKIGTCTQSGFDPATCWNEAAKQFVCPADAYVLGYNLDPRTGFSLVMNQESKEYPFVICPDTEPCASDPLCSTDVATRAGNCLFRINHSTSCNGATVAGGRAVCGNGNLEAGESCEKGMTKFSSCNGTNSYTIMTCDASCQWQPGVCNQITCGDGIRSGLCNDASPCTKNSDCANAGNVCNFKEVCDEGKLNGTYNHCNASCSGYSASCGNGKPDPGEKCDAGALNGQYSSDASGCALDCQGSAPYCGDLKVNGSEQCDGGSETSAVGCPKDPATGVQEIKTRSCNAPGTPGACLWSADWANVACAVPASVRCGDGIIQKNEQCDDGAKNGDNARCLSNCKLSSCGDGFIKAGAEQCDDGSNNVRPTDTTKLAAISANCKSSTCSYCTSACTVGTISGGYCGDGVTGGTEQCDNGGDNVNQADQTAVDAANKSSYTRGCPTNLDACGYCSTQCKKVIAPFCGDGIKQKTEACDAGDQNGVAGSGCDTGCACVGDGFYSGSLPGTVTLNPDYKTGAVAVSPAGMVNGFWPTIDKATAVWAASAATTSHEYFKFTFTLAHPVTKAMMIIGADNGFKAWIDDPTKSTVATSNNYQQPQFTDITASLTGSLTHTLYVEAWNWDTTSPSGLWFAIADVPDCANVGAIQSCKASGYTITSDNNVQITNITNPNPVPSNPPPTPLPTESSPVNASLITSPGDTWHSWLTQQSTPSIVGANWIWYSTNPNTSALGNWGTGPGDDVVTFKTSLTLPGVPQNAHISLMADDELLIKVNDGGYGQSCVLGTAYCPGNNCGVNQAINSCDIKNVLKTGVPNSIYFKVDNWNTKGGLLFKIIFDSDCGLR